MYTIENWDHIVVRYVMENKVGIRINCNTRREVMSKVMRLNRWRKQMMHDGWPELGAIQFCPREKDGKHFVLVRYDETYDMELELEDGTPLGKSITDWVKEESDRMENDMREEARRQESEISDIERRRVMRNLGLTEDDMTEDSGEDDTPASQESLTENQILALNEAERMKGEALTESERQHIINATAPQDIDLDF